MNSIVESLQQNKINEESIAILWQHIIERNDCALFITAFRGANDLKTNRALNKDLEKDIRKVCYGYNHVKGHFEETDDDKNKVIVEEESICVYAEKDGAETLKNLGIRLGKKYNQDAILFVADEEATLIFTTTRGDFKAGQEVPQGKWTPKSSSKSYSTIGKHNFVFEAFGDSIYPQKGSMIMAMLVEKYKRFINSEYATMVEYDHWLATRDK